MLSRATPATESTDSDDNAAKMHVKLGACLAVLTLSLLTATGYQLPNGGKIWALLVAGSNGYDNYRHQADLCHAYQILHKNGIPDENIIVMMFDDIANSADNPTPGVIINAPNGSDVYAGVPKDYVGADVNPANFLRVLSGDAKAMRGIGSGRVLDSGPRDHVFVNFVDHGAPGLLAFPSEELYADDLEKTLSKMSARKRFAKMVLYIEACESGSMFESILPDNIRIFVTTAADPRESSYACFFDDLRQTYLGDVFSVSWMADAESHILLRETLHQQFERVRIATNTSHVEEYGDLDLGSLHVSDFLGFRMSANNEVVMAARESELEPLEDAVPSHLVPVAILHRKLERTTEPALRMRLQAQIRDAMQSRRKIESTMDAILSHAVAGDKDEAQRLRTSHLSLSRDAFPCYRALATHFRSACFAFPQQPHALRQLYLLVNMCAENVLSVERVKEAMDDVCRASG